METTNALAALAALSQSSRLTIFRHLVVAGPAGASVGAIADSLAVPLPTLSFHLRTLREAGLVRAERRGRSIRYRAEFDVVADLIDYLSANCCDGRPDLCLPDRDPGRVS